ncbi:hypothetical protein [Paenibacillus spongiae]|uniref:MFS transporter n=1 Tax=Paenibacillus spongiae TaxID=2909671 RepID=A0ABY5S6K7_9BACL|nr:hypothetical protein [Paenibacillus spongiae]UVI28465.1 hypothetical protein L1F29_23855 [Paenibacillus spongiae]
MGDRFSQVAVLGLLLSVTGSGLAVGITFAIRLIPYLLFGYLLTVNGLEQAMLGIVLIAGSVTGGVIAAAVGVHATFILNALSFLVSALLLAQLTGDRRLTADVPEQEMGSSRSGSMKELRLLISESAFIRAMHLIFALWPIGSGIFNILISVYAFGVFHRGEIGIGVLYGALGWGYYWVRD